MPRRRSSRIDTLLDESEHFTAGEDFSFEAVATPSGPMTRSRRTSIYGGKNQNPTKPSATSASSRRKSMMPTISEGNKTRPTSNRRKSVEPENKAATGRRKSTLTAISEDKAAISLQKNATKSKVPTLTATRRKSNMPPPTSVVSSTTSRKKRSFVAEKPSLVAKKAKPVAETTKLQDKSEETTAPKTKTTEAKKMTKKTETAPKKNASNESPTFLKDLSIVLERLEDTPYKPSVDQVSERLQQLQATPDRVSVVLSEIQTPPPRRTPQLKKLLQFTKIRTPKNKLPKTLAPQTPTREAPRITKPSTFYTPQPTDPVNILKRNLKRKVQNHITETISHRPPSSPYEMAETTTENGSPKVVLRKMEGPRSQKDIITGTPLPSGPKARKVLGQVQTPKTASRRKRVKSSTPVDTENLPCLTESVGNISKISVHETSMTEESPSNELAQPELVTGQLGNMCVVM